MPLVKLWQNQEVMYPQGGAMTQRKFMTARLKRPYGGTSRCDPKSSKEEENEHTQSRQLVRRKDASWCRNWPSGANLLAHMQRMYIDFLFFYTFVPL